MIETALILGGSKNVFSDIEEAFSFKYYDYVIAVNDIGTEFEWINHWVTMHPDKMPRWLEQRRYNNFPDPLNFWTSVDRKVPNGITFEQIRNTRGGSGLLAIYVARKLGATKIVLAGIPMESNAEHYHTSGNWKECRLYRKIWEADTSLKIDVRSVSGWTKNFLGVPTIDWFHNREEVLTDRRGCG